jgi:hypothetical protein
MSGDVWAEAGRWFDAAWYLARNPDVARFGIDPLAHYAGYGEAEGRAPSAWFDPTWYRSVYNIPSHSSALRHFLERRTSGEVLPCAALWLVPRLAPWRDDFAAGVDGFDHYLRDNQKPERELLPDLALLAASGLFDPRYFMINSTSHFETALDPALHYCRFGWRRGLHPSSAFDPGWYAATNPEVARLRINPVTHYIVEGERAHRRTVIWFDPQWYRANHVVPAGQLALAHYLAHRHRRTVSPNPLFDVAWYVALHGASIPAGIDPFSHYLLTGVLRDIDPSPRFDARAWRHLHMAPPTAPGQAELPLVERNPLTHHLRSLHAAA